jgi:hypothetical protein
VTATPDTTIPAPQARQLDELTRHAQDHDASCVDSLLWISEAPTDQENAAWQCRRCPLLDECRTYGLAYSQEAGVYGGLTEQQRKRRTSRLTATKIRPQRAPKPAPTPQETTAEESHRAAARARRERLATMTPTQRETDRRAYNAWRQARYRAGQQATRTQYDAANTRPERETAA